MLEVIDRDGTKHNLAWLQADYGSGLVYHQAPDGMYPRFELRQVFITEGPTVLRFTVICAVGTPCVGQPVAYSFPSISSPSSDLPAVPNGADKAHWITRACLERCDPRGGHEFQIGKDSWTKGLAAASSGATALQKAFAADPNFGFYSLRRTPGLAASGVVGRGPYAVQVISPSTWSEGLDGIGWLGGPTIAGLASSFSAKCSALTAAGAVVVAAGAAPASQWPWSQPLIASLPRSAKHSNCQMADQPPRTLPPWRPDFSLQRPMPSGIGSISQWFGANPELYARFYLAGHNGIDYAAPEGTPVLAAHAGQCELGQDPSGFGIWIKVWSDHRAFYTLYAHLAAYLVTDGEQVEAGQQIGTVGSTGNSTGFHLHFGFKISGVENPAYGDWQNPLIGRKLGGGA